MTEEGPMIGTPQRRRSDKPYVLSQYVRSLRSPVSRSRAIHAYVHVHGHVHGHVLHRVQQPYAEVMCRASAPLD